MALPTESETGASIWEHPDGTWTVARHVVRSLEYYRALTPAEFYFVLNSLDAERFRWQWDNSNFFELAGVLDEAAKTASLVTIGDYAWRRGNLKEAQLRYEECIALGGSIALDGVSRLVRLYFVIGEYKKCIAMFRKDRGFLGMGSANCRALIAAALRTGTFDYELRQIIADHFHINEGEIDAMASALGSDDQLPQIRRWLSPKPAPLERSLDDLMNDGNTERARTLVARIPRTAEFIDSAAAFLDKFIDTGDSAHLDEMVIKASPFGVIEADDFVLSEAIRSRGYTYYSNVWDGRDWVPTPTRSENDRVGKVPERRLALLRRFPRIYDFLTEYLEVVLEIDVGVEPEDVISAILNVQWYKTAYRIDDTTIMGSKGGLGKPEIDANREWLEIVVREHPAVFDRKHFMDRESAIAALHRAYLFLRERFKEVQHSSRWMKESQLGAALATLFGKKEVERHSRPTCLSPQHLDFFLSRYSLAVEYMGPQHYRPIEFFGGEQGLAATQARDERKRVLCARMGIALVYVTHEEDVGRRAREIHEHYRDRS